MEKDRIPKGRCVKRSYTSVCIYSAYAMSVILDINMKFDVWLYSSYIGNSGELHKVPTYGCRIKKNIRHK